MKRYQFEVITEVLYIEAETQEEAEAKYDAFWTGGAELCPCGEEYCECVERNEETYHITTELEEAKQ
jgi:hypothetical protein